MAKPIPSPTITGDIFTNHVVVWYERKSGVNQTKSRVFTDDYEAKKFLEFQECRHVLLPVESFLAQQEHIIALKQLSEYSRAKPNGASLKMVRGMLAYAFLTRAWLAAEIAARLIPSFAKAAPGKTSAYYNHFMELGKNLRAFSDRYKNLNPTGESYTDFRNAIHNGSHSNI